MAEEESTSAKASEDSEAAEDKKAEQKGEEKPKAPAEGGTASAAAEESGQEPGSAEDVEVPEKFQKLIAEIEGMSVLDLAELVKILEKKFGVSASAPVMVAGAGAAAGAGESDAAAEEKDSFTVELTDGGSSKIAVIKIVREVMGKGLKEAKDIVDGAPKVIAEGMKKDEAEELKKKLEEAGASVALK